MVEDEQRRLTSTLHALDHTSRLAKAARHGGDFGATGMQASDARAVKLCAEAMQRAAAVAREVATLPEGHPHAAPLPGKRAAPAAPDAGSDVPAMSVEHTLGQLQFCVQELGEIRRAHRSDTLAAVANGTLTAGDAMARVDAVRILEALAHHAWRAAAHLVGRAE